MILATLVSRSPTKFRVEIALRGTCGNRGKDCAFSHCPQGTNEWMQIGTETPPVRQGPRRLGIQARSGGTRGRLPRVQAGDTFAPFPKSPDTAAATVQANGRRTRLSKATIRISKTKNELQRAVGRRAGQGLLHVLEREPWQGFPRPFSAEGSCERCSAHLPSACAESRGKSAAATAFRP